MNTKLLEMAMTMNYEEREILKYVIRYLRKGIIINSLEAKGLGYTVRRRKKKKMIFLTFYLSKVTCTCVIECPSIRMHVSGTMRIDTTYHTKKNAWSKVFPN